MIQAINHYSNQNYLPKKFERKNKVVRYRQVNENNLAEIISEIYGK